MTDADLDAEMEANRAAAIAAAYAAWRKRAHEEWRQRGGRSVFWPSATATEAFAAGWLACDAYQDAYDVAATLAMRVGEEEQDG